MNEQEETAEAKVDIASEKEIKEEKTQGETKPQIPSKPLGGGFIQKWF